MPAADGFLTAMNATAPPVRSVHRVAFFNPGSNDRVSVLRLVNRSSGEAELSIDGTDDLGLRPATTVRVLVPATSAADLTAAQLESGQADAIESGALGDGSGKWLVEQAVDRVQQATGTWPEAIESLGHFLQFDVGGASSGVYKQVQDLIERLQPNTLPERIRAQVDRCSLESPRDSLRRARRAPRRCPAADPQPLARHSVRVVCRVPGRWPGLRRKDAADPGCR